MKKARNPIEMKLEAFNAMKNGLIEDLLRKAMEMDKKQAEQDAIDYPRILIDRAPSIIGLLYENGLSMDDLQWKKLDEKEHRKLE